MKPCYSRRESVALLACGVIPATQDANLRQHLQACPGCREYFRQLSAVCEDHATAAAQLPEARVPSRLLCRVASRIRAGSEPRRAERQPAAFVSWGRIAGLATLLTFLAGSAIWLYHYQPLRPSPTLQVTEVPKPPPPARASAASKAGNNLATYRLALKRSPEALEELLSEEAARPTPNPLIALRLGPELPEVGL